MRSYQFLLVLLLSIGLSFFNSHAQAASIKNIYIMANYDCYPEDVSYDGSVVVGNFFDTDGDPYGFYWMQSNGIGFLENPPYYYCRPNAVSADGSVILGTFTAYSNWVGPHEAFRWTEADGIVKIGITSDWDYEDLVYAISNDGLVLVGQLHGKASRWTQSSGSVDLGDLPGGDDQSAAYDVSADGLVVVGYSVSESGMEAFRWTQEEGMVGLGDLPGGDFESQATAVSADGSVIVGWATTRKGKEAFRWTQNEGMVGLGTLNMMPSSEATDVSADGTVIVGNASSTYGSKAFIWDNVNGMRCLKDLLKSKGLNMTGWVLSKATAISGDGKTIVGNGTSPDCAYGIWSYDPHWGDQPWIANISNDSNFEKVIDNGDARTGPNGVWVVSSGANPYGYESLYTYDAGQLYGYEAEASGTYALDMWWTTHSTRSTTVPVEIYDGSTLLDTVYVNQKENGSQWNSLGVYEFSNEAKVVVVSEGNGKTTCADAVRFTESTDVSPEEAIDDDDAGTSTTGNWVLSSGANPYGSQSLYTYDKGATYSYELGGGGTYALDLWWTTHSTRSTAVPVEIYDGSMLLDTVYVNQKENGGQWNFLGVYEFSNEAKVVVISEGNGKTTCADAAQFTEST